MGALIRGHHIRTQDDLAYQKVMTLRKLSLMQLQQRRNVAADLEGYQMTRFHTYLKRHTEALVKDVGITAACELTGKSKATLGRYYSEDAEHSGRFMPVDAVAALEAAASHPHVTAALAELRGATFSLGQDEGSGSGNVNSDVVQLSQRFAQLMAEYHESIQDGTISANEARRLLAETTQLQKVLLRMKLHLEGDVTY